MRLDLAFRLERHCSCHGRRFRLREIRIPSIIVGRVIEIDILVKLDILHHQGLEHGADFTKCLQILLIGYPGPEILVEVVAQAFEECTAEAMSRVYSQRLRITY